MSLANKIFSILEGKWIISRVIENIGKLNGTALFEKSALNTNELLYQEKGLFEFYENSKSFETTRKYIYRLVNNQDIHVYFDENYDVSTNNSFFHQLNIDKQLISPNKKVYNFSAVHNCLCDVYNVFYEFKIDTENPEFSIVYDVKGPNKNYTSKTSFKRFSTIL